MRYALLGLVTLLGVTPLGATGCFYVEPINQRPSLDIRRDGGDSVQRGAEVALYSKDDDPEGHAITHNWSVKACGMDGCDPTAFDTSIQSTFVFTVPRYLADDQTTVRSLEIELTGIDELGAASKPAQTATFAVVNGSPDLTVDKRSDYQFVEGTPIDLFAQYSDPDDDLALVSLEWTAFSPTQATPTLVDISVPPGTDPLVKNVGKRIAKDDVVEGEWMVRVVAADEAGPPTEKLIMFRVDADGPPCLQQWSPVAPTAPGAYLPLAEPTIFQVPVVDDALDRYPGNPNRQPGDILGQATFEWSIKAPGASNFQPAGTTNQVTIDPQQYTPGDRLEVRVEVFDRSTTPVTCAAGDQTCALDATRPTCLQRQTWRVEAR